jgi:arylsulfatase A-like enzyme
MDPHDQYLSHEPEVPSYGKSLRDRYDGEVTFTDKYIGRLLDFVAAKPWAARTAIILTADHGEALGEHKQFSHGFELWENLVRVPLFFHLPNLAGRRIDVLRSAIDLAPTICDLLGVPPDPGFEGKSLVHELYGAEPEARDIALDLPMTSDSDRRRGLLHGNLKIVAYGDDKVLRVWDVGKDPEENEPISKGPEYDEMRARYFAFEKTVKDVPPYGCLPGVCLNGAYKNPKDGGAADARAR